MATIEELNKAQTAANGTGDTINSTIRSNAISGTTAPTTTATEGENRINAMFDAQKEAQLKQLENSYNQSMTAAQEAKDKIAPQYQTSANDLAVQYERNKRNLNQQAAANGLNTGTHSQMALSQNSAFQSGMGGLRTSESEALAAADRNMANLTANYQGEIAAAAADNDYKKAAALLDQYNTQYNRDMAKAEQLASYGDFSMFAQMYGQETANNMKNNWVAEHPQLALTTGAITQGQYDNIVNGKPINEGLDANGNRIAVASSGSSYSGPVDLTGFGAGVPLDYYTDNPKYAGSWLEAAVEANR